MKKEEYVETLVKNWPFPFVKRSDTGPFTSGAVSHRSIANNEAQGDKVPGRAMMGRHVIFPTRRYAQYLADKFFKG